MPSYRQGFLFRLEVTPPALWWSGVGPLTIGSETYLGGGELMDGLPAVQYLINGVAENLTITASGVDSEALRLMNEDKDEVEGAIARIGVAYFDADQQIVGNVDWEWDGYGSLATVDRQGDENGTVNRSVSITLISGDAQRSRSQLSFYTDANQRSKYPDDAIFSHVAGIAAGNSRRFDPK